MGSQIDSVNALAESRVGSTLRGKYHLDRLLGVGGMAAVYAATHRNGSRVAVKVLHPILSLERDVRTRFLREGYAANAVDHPGAVRVIDDEEAEDGAVFLVMELLEGCSVDTLWAQSGHRVRLDLVLSLSQQLLDVLAAAHEKGIVHRDVKPENMFLTNSGQVKLLDFGIARVRELATASTATRTGMTLGTPAFMSPEQAVGKAREIDALSDVYAVGAVMFTLLSGRYAHEGETTNEILIQAATQPVVPIQEVVPGLPAEVASLINRALAFDKAQRWPSARALRDAIARIHLGEKVEPIAGRFLADSTVAQAPAAGQVAAPTAPMLRAPEEPSLSRDPTTERWAKGVPTPLTFTDKDFSLATPRRPWWIFAIPALVAVGGSLAIFSLARPTSPSAGSTSVTPATSPNGAGDVFGFLTVVCDPACDYVLAGDRDLGPSPVVQVPLPAGLYQVSLLGYGMRTKVISVAIAPGEVSSRTVSMRDATSTDGLKGNPVRTDSGSAPTKKCSPPYTVGPNGIKRPKPECF